MFDQNLLALSFLFVFSYVFCVLSLPYSKFWASHAYGRSLKAALSDKDLPPELRAQYEKALSLNSLVPDSSQFVLSSRNIEAAKVSGFWLFLSLSLVFISTDELMKALYVGCVLVFAWPMNIADIESRLIDERVLFALGLFSAFIAITGFAGVQPRAALMGFVLIGTVIGVAKFTHKVFYKLTGLYSSGFVFGSADVGFLLSIGFLLGVDVVVALIIASALACAYSIRDKQSLGGLPFIPFLYAGLISSFVFIELTGVSMQKTVDFIVDFHFA